MSPNVSNLTAHLEIVFFFMILMAFAKYFFFVCILHLLLITCIYPTALWCEPAWPVCHVHVSGLERLSEECVW